MAWRRRDCVAKLCIIVDEQHKYKADHYCTADRRRRTTYDGSFRVFVFLWLVNFDVFLMVMFFFFRLPSYVDNEIQTDRIMGKHLRWLGRSFRLVSGQLRGFWKRLVRNIEHRRMQVFTAEREEFGTTLLVLGDLKHHFDTPQLSTLTLTRKGFSAFGRTLCVLIFFTRKQNKTAAWAYAVSPILTRTILIHPNQTIRQRTWSSCRGILRWYLSMYRAMKRALPVKMPILLSLSEVCLLRSSTELNEPKVVQ